MRVGVANVLRGMTLAEGYVVVEGLLEAKGCRHILQTWVLFVDDVLPATSLDMFLIQT